MDLLVLLGILLLPAVLAYGSNNIPSALTIAMIPGAFCLFTGFRLWQLGQTRMDCGTGLAVVFMCWLGSGFSCLATLLAAKLIQLRSREAAQAGLGLTPESR